MSPTPTCWGILSWRPHEWWEVSLSWLPCVAGVGIQRREWTVVSHIPPHTPPCRTQCCSSCACSLHGLSGCIPPRSVSSAVDTASPGRNSEPARKRSVLTYDNHSKPCIKWNIGHCLKTDYETWGLAAGSFL